MRNSTPSARRELDGRPHNQPHSQPAIRIQDLIDLEYFLHQGREKNAAPGFEDPARSEKLARSNYPDRAIYLSYEKTHTPPFDRRDLIRFWIAEKRKTAAKTKSPAPRLPGEIYTETLRILRAILMILALISGAGLAWSVLSYSGAAPINIFTCIWILVVPQLLLLLILGFSMAFTRFRGSFPQGPYGFILRLASDLFERALAAGSLLPGKKFRLKAAGGAGMLRQLHHLYGPVFFWPIFILAQLFGLFFNIGVFGATLLKLAITDLAFGWQSTLHPSSETVLRLVDLFALPWAWMPASHPTIEQIQGSQMILKDGMLHLSTPHLVSWWPFLCFAILFYGLLPRLILLGVGTLRQRAAAAKIRFATAECDRLIQRMRTPRVTTAGLNHPVSSQKNKSPLSGTQPQTYHQTYPRTHPPGPAVSAPDSNLLSASASASALAPAIVLVPEEIDPDCSDDLLADHLSHYLGLQIIRRIPSDMDPTADAQQLSAVFSSRNFAPDNLNDPPRVVVLAEAWQPPIRETMTWLKQLLAALPENTTLTVALIGKPDSRTRFTAPDPTDLHVWEQTLAALGNPFVRVENIGGTDE